MTFHLDLFAGIGGFALAIEMAELEVKQRFFSEINEYAIKIYQKNFPAAVALGNVRNIDASKLPIGEWIVTGGFPCQPFSIAGHQQGAKDERYLWGEITRIVSELKPTWCIFENAPQIENVAFSVSEFEVGSFKRQRNAETDSLYKLRSRQEISKNVKSSQNGQTTGIILTNGLKLQPNFAEWMMNYPADWTLPDYEQTLADCIQMLPKRIFKKPSKNLLADTEKTELKH